jgi:hypothetical protein
MLLFDRRMLLLFQRSPMLLEIGTAAGFRLGAFMFTVGQSRRQKEHFRLGPLHFLNEALTSALASR